MNYFKTVAKGIFWSGSTKVVTRLVGFVKIAILARILTPYDFGLFGIAALVLAFLEIITETGINVFFVQGEGEVEDYIDTAWLVSIARGVVIFLLLYFNADLIADFFGNSSAINIIRIVSFVALLRGFINPAVVMMQKNMEFKKEFWFQLTIFLVETIVAVVLAIIIRTPESLGYAMLIAVGVETFLSFFIFKLRPTFSFDFAKLRHVIGRGKWVTFSKLALYGYEEGDDIVVGKILNSNALGIYQMAYKISSLPLTEVAQVFGKVAFPVYTNISKDKQRLKKAYLKTALTVTLLVLPFGLLFYFFPAFVVNIILGSNWLSAVDILKILAVFGVAKAILYTAHPLFHAVKKQEYVATSILVSFIGMFVTIFPLVFIYGINGAAYSATIGLVISAPFTIYFIYKTLFQ